MIRTKIINKKGSQILVIPQELRADENIEYSIKKIDDVFIMHPKNDSLASFSQVIGSFPNDYMNDRNQPSIDSITPREEI